MCSLHVAHDFIVDSWQEFEFWDLRRIILNNRSQQIWLQANVSKSDEVKAV